MQTEVQPQPRRAVLHDRRALGLEPNHVHALLIRILVRREGGMAFDKAARQEWPRARGRGGQEPSQGPDISDQCGRRPVLVLKVRVPVERGPIIGRAVPFFFVAYSKVPPHAYGRGLPIPSRAT
jgi:hypothetical protein